MCCSSEGVERTPEGESSEENEDIEFFDAMEDSPAFITVPADDHSQHRFIYRSHNSNHIIGFCSLNLNHPHSNH